MSLESLPLKEIRLDGDTQPRVEMSQKIVDEYATEMAEGADFPPVSVMYDGDKYWLYDGFHRYHAACQLGREWIPAQVKEGTREEAVWESLGANKTHGLRREHRDKANAVRKALSVWPGRTDSYIAAHIGVDHKTVTKHRSQHRSTWEIPESNPSSTGEIPQLTANPSGSNAGPEQCNLFSVIIARLDHTDTA